jgi:hypothetical protein
MILEYRLFILIPQIEKNIRILMEKAAAEHGEKMAIHFGHDNLSLSYLGLNEKINQFGNGFCGSYKRGSYGR